MSHQNILIIITDQLSFRALPCYGNTAVHTPNIDRIAADRSVIFDRCYTTCPLCQPARASFWSGRYPHETGVTSNGGKCPVSPVPNDIPTLGETFRKAGYETYHFGKRHDADALRGFVCEPEEQIVIPDEDPAFPFNGDTYRDVYTTKRAVEFLQTYHSEKPLLMVADLVNPHNICGWVGENIGVHENKPTERQLPPLLPNFTFDDIENRPLPVRYICCSHVRQSQAAGWTEDNFRQYLAAYYYYLEFVDRQIGEILDALEQSGKKDDTLILLMADHGDSMAARGRVTKQVDFYEEVSRVPFIFSGKGLQKRQKHLTEPASLLDLYPTLCGCAGIEIPKGLRGLDLSPALYGERETEREYVVSEWHTEWGYTVSPGRMLCTGRYKYTCYVEDRGEELYDLEKDPYETKNLIREEAYQGVLAEMRKLLEKHLVQTGDDFWNLPFLADHRWRSHRPGYQNHRGVSAPRAENV